MPKSKGGIPQNEAYVLSTPGDWKRRVSAIGADSRGCMFAVGRLLREIRFSHGRIEIPSMEIASSPAKPLRGHQLGWRPTSNTYDLWGLKEYEQYIRDLIVWGTNAIELIPVEPGTDPEKNLEFNAKLADLIHSYGLQVWLWYPLDDRVPEGLTGAGLKPGANACPSEADGRKFLLDRRRRLFQRIKHIDAVFIPGGDPAGCPCEKCRPWVHTMLPLAKEIAGLLRERHPKATFWLSNQGFTKPDNDFFYGNLTSEKPAWLTGVVYAPWAEESCQTMRKRTPPQYQVREYPDITHTVRCQYPARDWDQAYALTLDREPPIYRPTDHAIIARRLQPFTCGALTYSDGVNDDLNKVIWSTILWDPKTDVQTVIDDYCRYFFGEQYTRMAADGIRGLERNWQGPLLDNNGVEQTYATWRNLEQRAPDLRKNNWRFQMALLRAMYDAHLRRNLTFAYRVELAVNSKLQSGMLSNPKAALRDSLEILAKYPGDYRPELKRQLIDLGESLHKSIGMQLSVSRWGASGDERGAILDHLDLPLRNRVWLQVEIAKLQKLSDDHEIREGIDRIVSWEDPGPESWYDDLGNPSKQTHLVRPRAWADDPGYLESPRCDFPRQPPDARQSWNNYAETLYGEPIVLRYSGLDRKGVYAVRATYTGRYNPTMTLTANGTYSVHGPVPSDSSGAVREWPIPHTASATGKLELKWDRVTGRGAQVSEVWLIKKGRLE